MSLSRMKSIFSILYIAVGAVTILEYLYVKGMFTGPLMMGLVAMVGLTNIVLEIASKKYIYALNYLISSIGLCMGYIALM